MGVSRSWQHLRYILTGFVVGIDVVLTTPLSVLPGSVDESLLS
jgi:hypothetical protein